MPNPDAPPRHAVVRRPAPTYHRGLTTRGAGEADHPRLLRQHRAYVAALEAAGWTVATLPALERFPDAHFVEDVAVVTPEVRVLARPGAASRRGEAAEIAPVLEALGPLERIAAPGTLDGGDVLVVGESGGPGERTCWIGLSGRTNRSGAEQLARLLEPHGYACRTVEVEGLHLKSSVNAIAADTLIVAPALAGHPAVRDFRLVETAPGEDEAANVLRLDDRLLVPAGFPATTERLAALGLPLVVLEIDEARRMDGGLTCLSLRFRGPAV